MDSNMEQRIKDVEFEEFFKLCKQHDWTFEYSDDHRMWMRGMEERKKLIRLLNEHQDDKRYERCYTYWKRRYFPDRS